MFMLIFFGASVAWLLEPLLKNLYICFVLKFVVFQKMELQYFYL
jgi:hypothetical protein